MPLGCCAGGQGAGGTAQGGASAENGYGSKFNHRGTAGFRTGFHLPGFHFGYLLLTHSEMTPGVCGKLGTGPSKSGWFPLSSPPKKQQQRKSKKEKTKKGPPHQFHPYLTNIKPGHRSFDRFPCLADLSASMLVAGSRPRGHRFPFEAYRHAKRVGLGGSVWSLRVYLGMFRGFGVGKPIGTPKPTDVTTFPMTVVWREQLSCLAF